MRLWNEIKNVFSEEASLRDLMDPTRAGDRMREGLLLTRELYRSIKRHDAMNLAAALAFKTLLALVPILAICLAVVSTLDMTDKNKDVMGETITYTDHFIRAIQDKLPSITGMESVINQIKDFANHARTIYTVGFIFLFWTAFSLLSAIESGFNRVWQINENRSILGRLNSFLATLVLVPVMMVGSVYFMTMIETVAGGVLGSNWGWALQGLLVIASIIMTCAAMTTLIYLMPNTVVRLRSALAGGALAGILFEVAKLVFRVYAGRLVHNYTKIYGHLLAVPLFLLWIWLVWIIVLLGVEISFTVQNFRNLAAKAELERRGIASRIYLAVRIVLRASACFHRGKNPDNFVEDLSEELDAPPYMIREIINVLLKREVLRRVVPDVETFLPAKDISVLTVEEVMAAVQADPLDVPASPRDGMRELLATMFAKVTHASGEVLGSRTFLDLIRYEEERARMQPEKTEVLEVDE